MRIIAGTARGRTLEGPKNADRIRPTADRVRQTIFDVLGQFFDRVRVLDLYAGTGALALEALSRGASHATLVDSDKEAQGLCRANAQSIGFAGQIELLAMPVERALQVLSRRAERFDLVFADPPYALLAVSSIVLGVGPLLSPEGRLVVEHDRREEAPLEQGALTRVDQRRFGDTMVSIYSSS